MAVYAAHLTRTLSGSPSVFQVAAQDALGATVKPALRKVLEYMSSVWPAQLGWAPDWFDELFLLLDLALQQHYLKHYDNFNLNIAASFSESFYGLVRVPLGAPEFDGGGRLPKGQECGSLLLLALLPYLGDKVARQAQDWRAQDEDGHLGKSKVDSAKRLAVRFHALLHCGFGVWRAALLASYMAGAARSPTPPLWALGLALRHAPPTPQEPDWRNLARRVAKGDWHAAYSSLPLAGSLLLRVAELGAFAVQFLRWWGAQGTAIAPLPQPPPPQRDERALRYKNKCPICLQSWRTPAVLPVSGYVFCYACITRHLRGAGACPVSGVPAAPDTLVRAYIDR